MIVRVFPRRTKWTPNDSMVFIGAPDLLRPRASEISEIHISCTFSWNKPEAIRIYKAWAEYYPDNIVKIGGPAFGAEPDEFTPGKYIKRGCVITSRGCPRKCEFCIVPQLEGNIKLIEIKEGHIIQDNNILACPRHHIESVFEMLSKQAGVEFAGGLDARLLKLWHVEGFKKLSVRQFFFALDGDYIKEFERAADLMSDFPQWKKRSYCLCGFKDDTPQKAEKRLQFIFKQGFLPFAQFYRGLGENPKTDEWRKLIRCWTRPAAMKAHMRDDVL